MNVFISTPEGERTLLARIERTEDLVIGYDRADNEDNTAAILARSSKAEHKIMVIVAAIGSAQQVIETIGFYLAREICKTLGNRIPHLARHAKKMRTRKKNKRRIFNQLKKHIKPEYLTMQ